MTEYTYICLSCDKEYKTNIYRRPLRRLCSDCAANHVGQAIHDLMKHEGKYYDKWKASMKAATRRL